MTAPRTRSRTPSFASIDTTTSNTPNAALSGAAKAFGRPAPPAKPANKTYIGANGALAAAASVGSSSQSSSPKRTPSRSPARPLVAASTGGSIQNGRHDVGREKASLEASTKPNLAVPQQTNRGHAKSPSQQAAWLAASRAPPETNTGASLARTNTNASQRPAVGPKPRRFSSVRSRNIEDDEVEKPTDSTPIAPTTSLVDLFERKSSTPEVPGRRPEPIVIKPTKDLPLESPKPLRTASGITSMIRMELENSKDSPKPVGNDFAHGTKEVIDRNSLPPSALENMPPVRGRVLPERPRSMVTTDGAYENTLRPPEPGRGRAKPSPSPLRHSRTEPIDIEQPTSRSATSPPEIFSPSSASLKSIPAQYNQLYPRKMTPSMTGDQLANAMVAGSLASSRQPSPARKLEPPPPPTRRHKHSALGFSRTPSPTKQTGMRHTLRKTEAESSDDEDAEDKLHPYGKHKKKRLVKRHPNKHHEGDRKRWRDAVTERERKRYEGVWAANKGMYYSFTSEEQKFFSKSPQDMNDLKDGAADQVSNIVTREIWSRSRLPEAALETIWDLVDNDSVGRLSKVEFVVGMWLIDQKLKGRKLPVKVSETVWASVRGLQGIKIRK